MDERKQSQPSVAIILLNYCNYKDTVACLNSISTIDYENYMVLVVDNHSPNESYHVLKEYESERVHIIQSGKNGGFAFGNNVGIRYALEKKYEFVLLLNNDTLVTPAFLTEMIEKGVIEKSGDIVTCRIMYNFDRDLIWYAGGAVDWLNIRATHFGINETFQGEGKSTGVSFISGCCMLISKSCLEKNGFLPEEYFMYYEDMDYCQHVVENGASLIYVPSSVIYHCVSASGGGSNSPFVIEWSNRSRRRFFHKYKHNIPFLLRGFVLVYCEIKTVLSLLRKGARTTEFRAYLKSYKA